MKVLVTDIKKEALVRILPLFELASQIVILNESVLIDDKDFNLNNEPYYIEENIRDLKGLLILCENNIDRSLLTKINWDEFYDFWRLILNIQKQREFGCQLSDIEYVYKKGLQLNLPITFQRASEDMGFEPYADFFVITGKSNTGSMILYQEHGASPEFVFDLEYNGIKKSKKITHWHPCDCQIALKDMIEFFNGNNKFKCKPKYVPFN